MGHERKIFNKVRLTTGECLLLFSVLTVNNYFITSCSFLYNRIYVVTSLEKPTWLLSDHKFFVCLYSYKALDFVEGSSTIN